MSQTRRHQRTTETACPRLQRTAGLGLLFLFLLFNAACSGPARPLASTAPAPATPDQSAGGAATDVAPATLSTVPVPERQDSPAEVDVVPLPAAPRCPDPRPGDQPPPVVGRSVPPPRIGAAAGIVIDGGSGAVLWGYNEHLALPPASTTKIVTALLAVERGDLDQPVRAEVDDRRFDVPTRMGLVRGDVFPLRDLIYGALLPSGNDAAIVIAHHLAGSEPAFAAMMNARLCELGLTDSTFLNASGLGRAESNLASAYDLAQVSRHALALPAFREIARARSWTARGTRTLPLTNLNEMLSWYPGADGVKIGWTPGAGQTIVASATRNGHRVIVALLNTPNRAAESTALLDWAFAAYSWEP